MNYTEFKTGILRLTGVDLNAYKENQMKRRIDANIRKHGCKEYEDYLALLKTNRTLYDEFLSYITINVSEFFRNPNQWVTLETEIIPMLLKKKGSIKIWSAACSTGDEPYSLAMLLSKFMPLHQIKIIATDIDQEILGKAKAGEYIDKHLTNVPKDLRDRFIIQEGDKYVISPEIKKCIQFQQHDLLKDPYPERIDLIVCRNVLIYFTEEAKNDIYTKFSRSLNKEGILFVGSTEQIIGSQKFNLNPYRIFFYEKQ